MGCLCDDVGRPIARAGFRPTSATKRSRHTGLQCATWGENGLKRPSLSSETASGGRQPSSVVNRPDGMFRAV